MFIGPTSQHPRIDEARNDSVYELEIAFDELQRQSQVTPWLVDRLFRNLLIDATGNTHRAEFCIDKMYSPDGPAGRLGLLELRGFEMPPHARMSLTQQPLMRAMVARFWHKSYRPRRLARWGTELHDRFAAAFVWQDSRGRDPRDRRGRLPPARRLVRTHRDSAFPRIGEFAARRALSCAARSSPGTCWEESAAGGTARYADSSVERPQVRATGLVGTRHALTCNGRALPLQPTGNAGESVAGVRYRAWRPWSALHPTIGVHAPLTFDLVDTWMSRSLGGCQYHVVHPGGPAHEDFPVNAYAAEGRRLARFSRTAHTPGPIEVRAEACPLPPRPAARGS
jgi:uncharacterized protein (DUF2126 family)